MVVFLLEWNVTYGKQKHGMDLGKYRLFCLINL